MEIDVTGHLVARAYRMCGLLTLLGLCGVMSGDSEAVWVVALGISLGIIGRAVARTGG